MGDLGAAKGVDRLIRVADRQHLVRGGAEGPDELALDAAYILILVDGNEAKLAGGGPRAQRRQGAKQKIVQVLGPVLGEERLVAQRGSGEVRYPRGGGAQLTLAARQRLGPVAALAFEQPHRLGQLRRGASFSGRVSRGGQLQGALTK